MVDFLYKMRLATKLQPLEGNAAERYKEIKGAIHNACVWSDQKKGLRKFKITGKMDKGVKKRWKKWAHNKWLKSKDTKDTEIYASMNRKVRRHVDKSKNFMRERKCEENRYMGEREYQELGKWSKT